VNAASVRAWVHRDRAGVLVGSDREGVCVVDGEGRLLPGTDLGAPVPPPEHEEEMDRTSPSSSETTVMRSSSARHSHPSGPAANPLLKEGIESLGFKAQVLSGCHHSGSVLNAH